MSTFNFLFFAYQKDIIITNIPITKFYILINTILTVSYLLEKLYDQLAKNILSEVLRGILNYILNNTIELEPYLTVFRRYIAELLELHYVLKKDI